ncbi:AI-2E family transporter [Candidatus Woesearchaeota archaeon]|nr:AI-2E family transporter [Candidatus Woesearchaeota archaeon]
MVKSKEYAKYIFVILLVFVIFMAYLVVKPFITALLTSAVLAYIFYPLYESLNRKINRKNASAFIVSILIILLLAIPIAFLVTAITKESQVTYIRAKQIFTTGDIFSIGCPAEEDGVICRFSNWVGNFIGQPNVRYHLEKSMQGITDTISRKASEFIFSIPTIVLNIFVTFFTTFYLFRDGKKIMERIKQLIPLKLHHQKQIFHQLDEITYAILYGSLLVAAVQGIVGAVGFYFFGVSSPLMWGILMGITALLPFIGTAIVWVPVSAVIIIQGITTHTNSTTLKGIGLLLYGALVVSTIDNFLRPYIVGKKGGIHPVLVLVGVLGGIAFFGFIGLIIGPLILAIMITFLDIYNKEKQIGNGLRLE